MTQAPAVPSNIIYASEAHFDIERVGEADQFQYRTYDGRLVKDKEVVNAINALVIPPNWQKVKIASNDRCYIRAYGYDEAQRKQYIYHERYLDYRNQQKFDRMVEFAECLPSIRAKAYEDVKRTQWDKQKVLALAVLTMDETYMRIGNTQYKKR